MTMDLTPEAGWRTTEVRRGLLDIFRDMAPRRHLKSAVSDLGPHAYDDIFSAVEAWRDGVHFVGPCDTIVGLRRLFGDASKGNGASNMVMLLDEVTGRLGATAAEGVRDAIVNALTCAKAGS